MRAIILAAGRGARMGDCTADIPKCLTTLAGRPLLYWQRDALMEAGVDEIAIVRGYKSDSLRLDWAHGFDNARWSETNMVRSLQCAASWLSAQPCLVSYGDIVYHPEIPTELLSMQSDLAITYDQRWRELWELRSENPLNDAEQFRITPSGKIASIGRRAKSLDEIEGQYMGLLKFTPSSWSATNKYLKSLSSEVVDRLDMTSLLQALTTTGVEVDAVPIYGRWCEVDGAEDIRRYEAQLAGSGTWTHDWRWKPLHSHLQAVCVQQVTEFSGVGNGS